MKNLNVNAMNYRRFEYITYSEQGEPLNQKPKNTEYELGDVVYIIEQNSIGVVLGNVDNVWEELRTDMDGMQGFEQVRPATMNDFELKDVHFSDALLKDVRANA